jgi:two-component sensor histidine kinase
VKARRLPSAVNPARRGLVEAPNLVSLKGKRERRERPHPELSGSVGSWDLGGPLFLHAELPAQPCAGCCTLDGRQLCALLKEWSAALCGGNIAIHGRRQRCPQPKESTTASISPLLLDFGFRAALTYFAIRFRTPLNAILGWSQLILGGKMKQEDIHKGIQIIERSARAQNKLIEDLLEMSSMISGKVRLDLQQLDIVSLVDAAVESVRPTAETKGIILQETIDRGAGWISGDANRLQQVFWNLLSNAIKFTPAGGRINVVMQQSGSFIEIRINDSGLGISADFLPYVFDRFRQAETSLSRQHGGLGLGLALVKQLVELHGGTVRAESSELNKGASLMYNCRLPPLAIKRRKKRCLPGTIPSTEKIFHS